MPQNIPPAWKDVVVSYDWNGYKVTEKLLMTMDTNGDRIVVLPTAGRLLASQPGNAFNLDQLRQDAIQKFLSLGHH